MAWPKQYLVWIKHDDGGGEFIANLYFSIINDNVAFIYVLSGIYVYEITE